MTSLGTDPCPGPEVNGGTRAPAAERWLYRVAATLSLVWALAAHLLRLSFPTVTDDERTYVRAGWLYLHADHLAVDNPAANFEHPPLAKYFFGLAQTLVGHQSLVAGRMVVVFFTVATGCVLAYWFARMGLRWEGLLAGLLVTVVPAMVPNVDSRSGATPCSIR